MDGVGWIWVRVAECVGCGGVGEWVGGWGEGKIKGGGCAAMVAG